MVLILYHYTVQPSGVWKSTDLNKRISWTHRVTVQVPVGPLWAAGLLLLLLLLLHALL